MAGDIRHASFKALDHPLGDLVAAVARGMERDADGATLVPDRKHYTHSFMDGGNPRGTRRNKGWITLPADRSTEFLERMAEAIDKGATVCVSEVATAVRPAFADFDIKTRSAKQVAWKLRVAKAYLKAARECYPDAPAAALQMCVLLRKDVKVNVIVDGETVVREKGGMHFVLPHLLLTQPKLVMLRDTALRILVRDVPLEASDGTWDKILDPKFDTLRMMGNQKAVRCKACRKRSARGGGGGCDDCGGRVVQIDEDGVYTLDYILNEDGSVNEAAMNDLADDTLGKLKLTSLRVVEGDEETPGFVCPEGIEPRNAEDVVKQDADRKRELMPDGDSYQYLVEQVRRIHPEFADVDVREIRIIKDRSGGVQAFDIRPWGIHPCLNTVACVPHNNVGVYFWIHRDDGDVVQKCECKCDKGVDEGRVAGRCQDVASHGQLHVRLPAVKRLEFFTYRRKQQLRELQMEAAENARGVTGVDAWYERQRDVMNMLSLVLFKRTMPQRTTNDIAITRALSSYLEALMPVPQSITAREAARREADRRMKLMSNHVIEMMQELGGRRQQRRQTRGRMRGGGGGGSVTSGGSGSTQHRESFMNRLSAMADEMQNMSQVKTGARILDGGGGGGGGRRGSWLETTEAGEVVLHAHSSNWAEVVAEEAMTAEEAAALAAFQGGGYDDGVEQ